MKQFRVAGLAIGGCLLSGLLSACGAAGLPWFSNAPRNCIDLIELALKKSHSKAISNQGYYIKHIILSAPEVAGYSFRRMPLYRVYVFSINDDGGLQKGWWSQAVSGFPYPYMRDNALTLEPPSSPEPVMKSSEGIVCNVMGIISSNSSEPNKISQFLVGQQRISWNTKGSIYAGYWVSLCCIINGVSESSWEAFAY